MTPEQIAAQVLHCAVEGLRGERIKRGLTNQSWRVQGGGHDVIVRLSNTDEHALQLDRNSETQVLRIVEHADIGPRVITCEPQRRVLITHTLPGHEWSAEQAREPANVSRLAALMRRLHALPVASGIQTIDLVASLRGYWTELETRSDGWPRDSAPDRARALQFAQASNTYELRCLCHTDLHHFNIIDDGEQLRVVDWEYAGIGDPFFDLASVCCWHQYNVALRRRLLREYFGEVSNWQLVRLDQMCWLFDYIKELWFAVRGASRDSA